MLKFEEKLLIFHFKIWSKKKLDFLFWVNKKF